MTSTPGSVCLEESARQYLHYLSVTLLTRCVSSAGNPRTFHRDGKKYAHTARDVPILVDPERLVEATFTIKVIVNALSSDQN